nr:MAG TPA: hypothetical protein [Caudoviricetes sp.]
MPSGTTAADYDHQFEPQPAHRVTDNSYAQRA